MSKTVFLYKYLLRVAYSRRAKGDGHPRRAGPPRARRSMNVATWRTASRGSNGREQPEMNPLVRVRRQCSKEQRGCHIRPRLNDRIEILELIFYDVQVSSWHGRSELHEERAQMHLNG